MARQPTRQRRGSSNSRPFAFSSFARTVDRVASTSKVKRSSTSKTDRKVPSKLQGDGLNKRSLKEKAEYSDSSSEEENGVSSGSEEENGVSSGSEEENGGIVQLDFDFFDPKPNDFHGVKVLLKTYLDDKQWDLSGFVDLIIEQSTVGTVIKVEDEDDEEEDCLYSVVTVLNLGRYKDHRSIMDIKEFLLKVCKDKNVGSKLQILLEEQAQNVGLLVSEHVVNLPPELLPPLYNGLFDEVAQAAKDEPTKELRQSFSFKMYLFITRIYKIKNSGPQKRASKRYNDEPVLYVWPEDEILHKLSLWSFSFPLHTRDTDEVKNYRPMGLVMAIEANKVPIFRQQLQSLISGS